MPSFRVVGVIGRNSFGVGEGLENCRKMGESMYLLVDSGCESAILSENSSSLFDPFTLSLELSGDSSSDTPDPPTSFGSPSNVQFKRSGTEMDSFRTSLRGFMAGPP